MNYGFAFFVIFGQRPGANRLNVSSSETRPAIGVKDISARFVEDSPDLESFAEFPATPVKYRATSIKLCRFTLIAGAFREVVKSFLTWNFQPDCFKRCVHESAYLPAENSDLMLLWALFPRSGNPKLI